MAKKLRNMLGDKNAQSTKSLLQLIEAQEKPTVCKWCLDYAEAEFLPIFERRCPGDYRPRTALNAARDYLDGKLKFAEVKSIIWYFGENATSDDPVALAAERAIGQAASVVRYPSKWHALAVFLYGAAAIAYDRIGLDEGTEAYDAIAEEVCADMAASLQTMVNNGA
ncbi:hypothetical protein EG832_11660 [bacterium]|nr:hypothetical protein [bacterium]